MLSYIKKTVFFFLFIVLTSCSKDGNNKESSEHDHAHHENENKSENDNKTIATLTLDQLKAVDIRLGNIEYKELSSTLKANGVLKVPNTNKANITTLYGGIIKTINVKVGDNIKKGQVIATIVNTQFIQLQEEYINISNKIIIAEQEVERQEELNKANAGSLKSLQVAKSDLKDILTRKTSLEYQLKLMGVNPSTISSNNFKSLLTITSPIDGTISSLSAIIGSYIDASSTIAQVLDNSSLHLDLQVFEKDLPFIKVGQDVHFTLTNNPVKEYDAQVFGIASSFGDNTKTITVHCYVSDNKENLIDGMNVSAIVSLDNVKSPAVPIDAIVNDNGKDYIFVVTDKLQNEDNHDEHNHDDKHTDSSDEKQHQVEQKQDKINFEKIEVFKGVTNMGYTSITLVNAIKPDDKIVTKGAFFVNAKLNKIDGHNH